jgi:hypothetical protein
MDILICNIVANLRSFVRIEKWEHGSEYFKEDEFGHYWNRGFPVVCGALRFIAFAAHGITIGGITCIGE